MSTISVGDRYKNLVDGKIYTVFDVSMFGGIYFENKELEEYVYCENASKIQFKFHKC